MTISEKDWKAFKRVKEKALDRFCQSVLDETKRLCIQSDKTSHERYLEVWNLIQESNKAMGQAFDGHSRSRAMLQLKMMRSMKLVCDDDLQDLDADFLW